MPNWTRTALRDREGVGRFLKCLHDHYRRMGCYDTAECIDRAYQSYMQGDSDMDAVAEIIMQHTYIEGIK